MKILSFLLFFFSISLYAQDFSSFLSPETPTTTLDLEGMYLPDQTVEDSYDDSHVLFQSAEIHQRVYKGSTNTVVVSGKYQKLDLNSKNPLLNDFYNQQFSVGLRRRLSEEKFWLGNVSFGSASDKPFKNSRDNTIGANFIYKSSPKLLVIVNYSNNRAFLNNIPIPGVIYVAKLERQNSLIIGFPFILWTQSFNENWSVKYLGLIPWTHRLRIFYEKYGVIRPYIGIEQHPQNFFRHDREDRFDRFFWFERRLSTGVEGSLSKGLKYDFGGGYAFDRQFFEAQNFSQEKEFLINLENSWFINAGVKYKF